jgi:diguanylate cyclase (GGDEF)-like protein/PAS domain S-box-containing protein
MVFSLKKILRKFKKNQDTERKLLELKLEESYKNLAVAQELAHTGSWKLDIINNKSIWSEEAYRIYGITPEQYDGTYEGFLKYVYPEDISIIHDLLEDPPTEPFDMEYRIIRSDGSIRYVYQRVIYKFDDKGNPTDIYGTIQDITDKREMEKSLEVKQEEIIRMQKKAQIMIQNSIDVFEIISSDGTIKYMSDVAERVIGYKAEERIGKKIFDYYTGKELEKLKKMINFVLKHPGKKIQGNIIFKNKDGKEIFLDINMQNFINDPTIEGIIVNFRDITRRINIEKRMAYISTHDDLTGLPNHKHFNKKLRLQCRLAKETKTRFALMILDVVGIKYVNYSFGYELGEKLLIDIVNRLKGILEGGIFISRYSDDQFAIIVHGLETYEEYKDLANIIVNIFSKSFRIDKYNIDIFVNIGICIYPKDAQNSNSLMKQSRIALIRAKNEGKNNYKFYSSDLDVQNYKEFILRSDLHNAIDSNQLQVYYQPIINLKTNEIISAEALIRWEHPDWGIINPDEFIYIAEEIGFIIDIGKWILKNVCQDYLQWLKLGYSKIKVSINYSVIQVFEKDFIENIINTINDFGLDPHFLIMEITESVLMKNPDKAISDIKKLQSFGIQIAIDDFGTGYSSLAYLKSFNIDILKLDSSFIKDITNNFASKIIIKSMINMSKELKIKMVAEGIETWEQLSLLRELNCFSGQGYIYSMPVVSNKFERILSKHECKPNIISFDVKKHRDRRKYSRIQFQKLLEASSTVKEINGKSIDIGDTKVLIKDIAPGGLCFISNLNLPIEKNVIMKFGTQLIENEIQFQGRLMWAEEMDNHLYEYGVEFAIGENDRKELVRILNTVQIRMRKDILFAEGNFVTVSPNNYFS